MMASMLQSVIHAYNQSLIIRMIWSHLILPHIDPMYWLLSSRSRYQHLRAKYAHVNDATSRDCQVLAHQCKYAENN